MIYRLPSPGFLGEEEHAFPEYIFYLHTVIIRGYIVYLTVTNIYLLHNTVSDPHGARMVLYLKEFRGTARGRAGEGWLRVLSRG